MFSSNAPFMLIFYCISEALGADQREAMEQKEERVGLLLVTITDLCFWDS
jgi:hypothetical protein